MSVYDVLCLLTMISILISFFNAKIGKMQSTIAITTVSLIMSLLIVLIGKTIYPPLNEMSLTLLNGISFQDFLLKGILGFLLFAGGLGVKLDHFKDQKWEIAILSLGATLFSTFFVGIALWLCLQFFTVPFDFIYCLLFGALISPTDPIAVLAIVKKLKAPQRISTQIEGESLFNDGFGLVIFITVFSVAFSSSTTPTAWSVSMLFLHEAVGGILYGSLVGIICHYLIRSTNDSAMEFMLTVAIPTAGYVIADLIHVSGPLAMVVAGIIIGNRTRIHGFSKDSKVHLDSLWGLVDELFNGLLFLLIGLTLLQFDFHSEYVTVIVIAIPLVLIARYFSVKLPYVGFRLFRAYNPYSVKILTWGGLRGGLGLAMAMAVPRGVMVIPNKNIDVRDIILVMTYGVVFFSIIIQGSTVTSLIKKANQWEKS
ncbi:MAG: sodium:proton antiporter [Psychromonas sp.]|nr:sodium:proton antiporter [Psychromonas sp.]